MVFVPSTIGKGLKIVFKARFKLHRFKGEGGYYDLINWANTISNFLNINNRNNV